MATLSEELLGNRERLREALTGLVREQESVVQRLTGELAERQAKLDRTIVKLMLFVQQFGRGATDTVLVQRDAEDTNTPVVETTQRLERHTKVLELFRQKLADVEAGRSILPEQSAEVLAAVDEQLA